MRTLQIYCCGLLLQLAACASPSEGVLGGVDYKMIVAKSLNYYVDGKEPKRYSISEPWRPVVGQMMVCAREDIPDGKGGYAPSTDYSMYHFDDGKIIAMIKDSTLFGCPNRQYSELPRAPRSN